MMPARLFRLPASPAEAGAEFIMPTMK